MTRLAWVALPTGRWPRGSRQGARRATAGGRWPMHWLLAAGAACAVGLAPAAPLVPTSDTQIVEVLPPRASTSAHERRLQQRLQHAPRDAQAAATLARLYLQQARQFGDARHAGRALGVLSAWPEGSETPVDVLLMLATVQQYLHEFDAAARTLQRLIAREPQNAQAWLTLATVRRVQGRYADSDAACDRIARTGQALVARACGAENTGLRGDTTRAREELQRLLAEPGLDAPTRAWLLVTQAELAARSADAPRAQALLVQALALAPGDDYARLALADLLLDNGRAADALALTAAMARSDAVLVRRAIAGKRAGAASARADADELAARFAQAEQRRRLLPDNAAQALGHAREHAMFALWVQQQPARAVALARQNLRLQREPIDLLLLARAARAGGDDAALRELRSIRTEMGLHDARLDAPG